MKPKVFSVKEANKELNGLNLLLDDLRQKKQQMMEMHDHLLTFELLKDDSEDFYETEDGKEYLDRSSSLENLIVSFEEDIRAVSSFGCILRNIERGIVDFYHVQNKELIFLNWVQGEDKIGFWHELDSNYSERIPLTG